jgi:2-hydroxychromene-2-carboxylate isomerase
MSWPWSNEPGAAPNREENVLKSTWYFDVISPFAYLALDEVEDLARTVEITYKPILFSALLKHHGHLGPAEIPAKRTHTYRLCIFEAQRRGTPLRFPPAHPFHPIRALRLLSALDGEPRAVRAVMNHVWRDGNDPAEDDAWAALCRDLGLKDHELLVGKEATKAKLRQDTDEATRLGVFGVPTLVIGEQLFWGLDAMPMARAYLADGELFETGEMKRVGQLPNSLVERMTGNKRVG